MKFLVLAVALVACVEAQPLNRQERSVGVGHTVAGVGSIGWSGIVLTNGEIIPFSPEFMQDIVSIGESGIITKSGKNVQLTRDLTRVKRHIMNESGMLTSWGQAIVFKKPYTTILLDGPSAMVLSDGQLIQKPRIR